jgi:hypothetical protein
MELKNIAKIQSGYINRGKIDPRDDGTCFLLQAKDVDADHLSYRTDALVRFMPTLSGKDWFLKPGDILFMARGARNFSVLIDKLPDSVLAAACFFVVRISNSEIYRNICAGTSTSHPSRNISSVSAVGEFICRWSDGRFWKASISRSRRLKPKSKFQK